MSDIENKVNGLEKRLRKLENQNRSNKVLALVKMVENDGIVKKKDVINKFGCSDKWATELMKKTGKEDGIEFQRGLPGYSSFLYNKNMSKKEYAKGIILRKLKGGECKKIKESTIKKSYDLSEDEYKNLYGKIIHQTRRSQRPIKRENINGEWYLVIKTRYF